MHLPDPKIGEMSRLEQVIKGSKCEYAKHNPGSRERLPISPDLLLKMRKVWEKNKPRTMTAGLSIVYKTSPRAVSK